MRILTIKDSRDPVPDFLLSIYHFYDHSLLISVFSMLDLRLHSLNVIPLISLKKYTQRERMNSRLF